MCALRSSFAAHPSNRFTGPTWTWRRSVLREQTGQNATRVSCARHAARTAKRDPCPWRPSSILELQSPERTTMTARFASSPANRDLLSTSSSRVPPAAQEMVEFINNSWTSYHATATTARKLEAAGFVRLSERDEWNLVPGGKYFFTRNMSSIVAFAVGVC